MGQQQLLLLVLGIVIVGLAVVAGINAFSENQAKSQKDAILNEGMRIATDIQSYALKPTELGGGGGSLPAGLAEAGIDDGDDGNEAATTYTTPWGTITYASSEGTLTLDPTSSGDQAVITVQPNGQPTLENNWDESTPNG